MLFCKGGATYEVLEEVLTRLQGRKELLSLIRVFAGKVFKSKKDQKRLDRRFAMLHDFLEDSWTYQQTIDEGQVKGLRRNIVNVVQVRFPALYTLAKSKVESLIDLEQLEQISLKVSTVRTAQALQKYLLALK